MHRSAAEGRVRDRQAPKLRRVAIDVSRVQSRHSARRAGDGALALLPAPGDVVDQAEARNEVARLRTALAALPEAQREVIALGYYGGLTHTEIAQRLGVPFGTVKGRMRLGMDKLRLALEPADASEAAIEPPGLVAVRTVPPPAAA